MRLVASRADGSPTSEPGAITPLFRSRLNDETGLAEPDVSRVFGTGFYVSRYGLMITAQHVIDELKDARGMLWASAWNWTPTGVSFAGVSRASFHIGAPRHGPDIAICQVHGGSYEVPIFGQPHDTVALRAGVPSIGASLATYAYPGNWDVRASNNRFEVFGDSHFGTLSEIVAAGERQFRYVSAETNVPIPAGASGGPMFFDGHVFGVNHAEMSVAAGGGLQNWSTVIPVSTVLDLPFDYPAMPPGAEATVPVSRRGTTVTLRDLGNWGHILILD